MLVLAFRIEQGLLARLVALVTGSDDLLRASTLQDFPYD